MASKNNKPAKKKTVLLKTLNIPQFIIFIAFNIAVISLIISDLPITSASIKTIISNNNLSMISKSAIIPIILAVMSHFISSNWKARLVFWKWNNPLPGSRVFSSDFFGDHRIDRSKFKQLQPIMPNNHQDENALWFEMYKIYGENPIPSASHRSFLLLRDISAASIIFMVAYIAFSLANQTFRWWALLFFSLQYLFLSISAKNVGNRFCLNVILEYIQASKSK